MALEAIKITTKLRKESGFIGICSAAVRTHTHACSTRTSAQSGS